MGHRRGRPERAARPARRAGTRTGSLARDLGEAQRLRDDVVETSRELQRRHFGLDEEARTAEIDRRADQLAATKGQLQLARDAAETRDQGFVTRLAGERNALNRALAGGDSDAAARHRTAIERLESAQTEWRELDASNIRTLERIHDNQRTELVGQNIDDGLWRVSSAEELDRLADQRLRDSGSLESAGAR